MSSRQPPLRQSRTVGTSAATCCAASPYPLGAFDPLHRPRTTEQPTSTKACAATPVDRAVRAAGLDGLTPHELRLTAALLAIASGADGNAVRQMLGYASATKTPDVYAGLFGDEPYAVCAATQRAHRGR